MSVCCWERDLLGIVTCEKIGQFVNFDKKTHIIFYTIYLLWDTFFASCQSAKRFKQILIDDGFLDDVAEECDFVL